MDKNKLTEVKYQTLLLQSCGVEPEKIAKILEEKYGVILAGQAAVDLFIDFAKTCMEYGTNKEPKEEKRGGLFDVIPESFSKDVAATSKTYDEAVGLSEEESGDVEDAIKELEVYTKKGFEPIDIQNALLSRYSKKVFSDANVFLAERKVKEFEESSDEFEKIKFKEIYEEGLRQAKNGKLPEDVLSSLMNGINDEKMVIVAMMKVSLFMGHKFE